MGQRSRIPRRRLVQLLAVVRPDIVDPAAAIVAGTVLLDGAVVANPASLVRRDASVAVRPPPVLRGEAKLRAALARFRDVRVAGRVALDAGAAAGGFTRVVLAAGELDRVAVAEGADLIGFVKPMFELRLASAPLRARRRPG